MILSVCTRFVNRNVAEIPKGNFWIVLHKFTEWSTNSTNHNERSDVVNSGVLIFHDQILYCDHFLSRGLPVPRT